MTFEQAKLRFNKRRKLPIILQDERAECGHACVAMISHFFGHSLDNYALRMIHNTSTRGVTLGEIDRLLAKLGFMTRALRVPLEELSLIKCPAILHWNLNHFVVLKGIKKGQVVIHDPALGVCHYSVEEFSRSFTGIVLEVEKAADFSALKSNDKLSLYQLVKTMQGITKFIVLLLLLSFTIEVLSLLNPLFMQYVTDDVLGFSELANLYVIAGGFFILIMIQIFTEYIRGSLIIYFTSHLTAQFSANVVNHILKLPLDFFEKRHKGDIQSKFQAIDQIQKKISTDFVNTVLDGLMILINLGVMMVYSRVLTTIVIAVQCIGLGFRYLSYYDLKEQAESSIYQHAKATSLFLETLQGIVPIKSFLKEQRRFNAWRNCYTHSLNADIRVAKTNIIYKIVNQLLFHIEQIIIVCVGVTLVLDHVFSVGMLIAFLSYRLLLVNKAFLFIQNIFDYKLISIQLRRLSDILFQQPELIEKGSGLALPVNGSLALKNISFKYNENDHYLLHNINLSIQAGEKIAIIGPSGCGKTTFLKVVMGLLKSNQGEIYLDGIAIKDYGIKNYRDLTASVMQDDALLSGSILDNISFFDEQLDIERVYEAAKLAYIHEDICRLAMGYETLVGEMGSILSGGQKQRLLLARALYKKPKIIFLDEATSHLDLENEKNINNSLKSLAITQIVIAHRQETIQMADKIIDLNLINQLQIN